MTEVVKRLVKAGDLATGAISTVAISDYAVSSSKIATGAIRGFHLAGYGTQSSLPDTDTEIAHNLGSTPLVLATPAYDSGVSGYVMIKSRTASSFVAKASVSGVDMEYWLLLPS